MSKPASPLLRLENDYVRAEVDPARGGAVAALHYGKAMVFPLIAERWAGIAGTGVLFAPWLEVDAVTVEMSGVASGARGRRFLSFSAGLAGLAWERQLRIDRGETRFSIRDLLHNRSGRGVTVRLGMTSHQEAAAWRLTDRSWIGDERRSQELRTSSIPVPGLSPSPTRVSVTTRSFFWRQISQYGTGLLYRAQPTWQGEAAAEVSREEGSPLRVEWRSARIRLAAGGSIELAAEVLVDEGGGPPDPRHVFGPVLLRADIAAAGRRGEPVMGYVTVVSHCPRRIRIAVAAPAEIICKNLRLVPGKVARLPVIFHPATRGSLTVRTVVTERGRKIATAESDVVIDGNLSQRAWRLHTARMPEESYRGTWEEISEQMASNPRPIGGPTSIEHTVGEIAAPDNDLSFYRDHLPYYARLVSGMARAVGVPPERLGLVKRGQRDKPIACMDIACYGPDGPINAFSKERDGPDYEGLGYVKVVPSEGCAFHTYGHHGVNSAGLSISGATLNEDVATARTARQELAEWKRAGRHTLPAAADTWMLLAMCRNVEEALALIASPLMPWESTGNMLLLDRAGRAARVESAGIDRQIFRHFGKGRGFFVAGNYPHERADGRFRIGARWGQAANTMLRERFLRDFARDRQGCLSLEDVRSLLQSHEAGGLCQHHHDNPGQLYTVCSSIAVTRASELWLSQGPPCQVQYLRYRLDP